MNGQYKPGDIVLGSWTLVRLIGEGSFGRVYEAEREDFGAIYKAAVKIITIPKGDAEVRAIRSEGMDEESLTAYFRSFVEEIVREFALMSELKGTANVVSYEDHTVIPHTENIGWDILIRMELLTPLLEYSNMHTFTHQTVIKLGTDICRALELCQKFNIVHRDIKPENIFVSKLGDFKLGDFGIARTVEKTTSGLSKKGTYTYMAPEVYRDEAYGSSVDMYSLGIVLYRFLNDNRTPFMPAYPTPITYNDQEAARAKRLGGAKIPVPKNTEGQLAEIVLKACAYDPKDRFSSPLQMRNELEAIMYKCEETPIIYPPGDEVPAKSVEYVDESLPQSEKSDPDSTMFLFRGQTPVNENDEQETNDEKTDIDSQVSTLPDEEDESPIDNEKRPFAKKIYAVIGIACVCIAALVFSIFFFTNRNNTTPEQPVQPFTTLPLSDEPDDMISESEIAELLVPDADNKLVLADVLYKTLSTALTMLDAQGMIVIVVEEESDNIAAGIVSFQDPAAGTPVEPGTNVTVIVSLGSSDVIALSPGQHTDPSGNTQAPPQTVIHTPTPTQPPSVTLTPEPPPAHNPPPTQTPIPTPTPVPHVQVPNVVGRLRSNAVDTLRGQNLNVSTIEEFSDSVANGNVISQNPSAGSSVTQGSTVTIVVSKGREPVQVANVIGRSQSDARTTLQNQGFTVSVSEAFSDTVASGNVISQNPSAGTTHAHGGSVAIVVSKGRELRPPGAPQGLSATITVLHTHDLNSGQAFTVPQFVISWNAVSGANYYEHQRFDSGSWSRSTRRAGTSDSEVLFASPGHFTPTYLPTAVRVRAVNDDGESAWVEAQIRVILP